MKMTHMINIHKEITPKGQLSNVKMSVVMQLPVSKSHANRCGGWAVNRKEGVKLFSILGTLYQELEE